MRIFACDHQGIIMTDKSLFKFYSIQEKCDSRILLKKTLGAWLFYTSYTNAQLYT